MRIGILSRLLAPWRGGCNRCDTSWLLVRGHETRVAPGVVFAPLCERCWADVPAEERPAFYYAAWDQERRVTWDELEAAVYADGQSPAVERPAPWRRAAAVVRAAAARAGLLVIVMGWRP